MTSDSSDRHAPTGTTERAGDLSQPHHIGKVVGGFLLLEAIGEGSTGLIFRAERADGEFTDRVAVKLLTNLFTPEALRRFRVERQALATLNHPGIVALIDGGLDSNGQAYIAMQYVEGAPITDYCARGKIALRDRVALFQRVCAAVQHAHQNGIVHRDLKPANILVSSDGAPKVLDFGIAKLLDSPGGAGATVTSVGRPLTPNYASPEQLRGLPVTTACDVYALGVLLYELLAGVRPYETGDKPLDEVLAIVTEREPRRPSGLREAPDRVPYDRRRLRGDLDAIVLKAVSKDPALRYASPQALSEDLGRHLAGQAVLARKPSLGYLAGRLARRHRAPFAAAAVSLVALVGALGVSMWQTRVARAERDRAARRFDDVRQLANALIFKIHDEVQPLSGSTPVRKTIVQEALVYLERLSLDRTADAALRLELAKGYHRVASVQGRQSTANLGDRPGALASLNKAIALLRPLLSESTDRRAAELELGRAQLTLADVLGRAEDVREQSRAAVQEAIAIAEALGARDPLDQEARRLLGSAIFQMAILVDADARPPLWERAAAIFEALLAERPGDPDRQRNVALMNKYLGSYYQNAFLKGDFQDHTIWERAQAYHERAKQLDEQRLTAAPSNRVAQLDLAIDYSNMAWLYRVERRLPEATSSYEKSLVLRRRLAESDPKDVYARNRLSYALAQLAETYGEGAQRRDAALRYAEEAVAISESLAKVDPRGNRANVIHRYFMLAVVERAFGMRNRSCVHVEKAAALARGVDLNDYEQHPNLAEHIARDVAACQN